MTKETIAGILATLDERLRYHLLEADNIRARREAVLKLIPQDDKK